MVVKQPNGKYCYVSGYGKITYKENLTEEDYIALVVEQAKEQAKKDLQEENLQPITYLIAQSRVPDETLRSMGCVVSYEELCKLIPRIVVDQHYSGRDCTTYGKCPTCGNSVSSGIGGTDEKCHKCRQVISW